MGQVKEPQPAQGSRVVYRHLFDFDAVRYTNHVHEVMQYWRGKRFPRGVDDQDAVRCRDCDFQEQCKHRSVPTALDP